MGQVFAATTNPSVSTGDGVALALRAGAAVTDLEFVQFHPTVARGSAPPPRGQQPLVTEAVRGEGAYLVDDAGKRFMLGQHELAELAPRDVVAKAIHAGACGRPAPTTSGSTPGARRASCWSAGSRRSWRPAGRPASTRSPSLIPVAPAAHYASGGVRTDLHGRTAIPGLYACGEVACTGVHGANRLASNSLLEGLVFAARIAADLAAGPAAAGRPGRRPAWRPAGWSTPADPGAAAARR